MRGEDGDAGNLSENREEGKIWRGGNVIKVKSSYYKQNYTTFRSVKGIPCT